MTDPAVPTYERLPRPDATGLPLAWCVWGPDDRLGTLNHITPEKSAEAARLVRSGKRINLDLPLNLPLSEITLADQPFRRPLKHHVASSSLAGLTLRDDRLDDFYLQGASQWDGLTHIGDPHWGFYNGANADAVHQPAPPRAGIGHVAAFGIFTRGILVDLPPFFAKTGRPWSVIGSHAATAEDVAACLRDQSVSVAPGDVLVVHIGWLRQFLDGSREEKDRLFHHDDFSGLAGDEPMWRFLWDHRIAAVAADTISVEAFPLSPGRPSLHWAIARLGLTLGELFDLRALIAECRSVRRYEFLFVAKPLNLTDGVGSPANAMAVF